MAKKSWKSELRKQSHSETVRNEMRDVVAVLGTEEYTVYALAVTIEPPEKDDDGDIASTVRLSRHTSRDLMASQVELIITSLEHEIQRLKEALK